MDRIPYVRGLLPNDPYGEVLKESPFFFVYGTLKEGYNNNRLLKDSEFIGEASTQGKFTLLDYGPPALVGEKTTGVDGLSLPVKGEVYRVTSKKVVERLDELEGYPRVYSRDVMPVILGDSKVVNAWCYHMLDREVIKTLTLSSVVNGEWEWSRRYHDFTEEN